MEMQQHFEPESSNKDSEIISLRRNKEYVYEPAGFLVRSGASFLDGAIIGVMTFPLDFLSVIPGLGSSGVGLVILTSLKWFAYFFLTIWFISKKGGLPGKLMLGLKIVNVDNGLMLSPGKALYRETIGKFLSVLLLFSGYLMVIFRRDKRALHDIMSKSQVLRKVKVE
jgi:uncharacterized RDD family membrane protein YckC